MNYRASQQRRYDRDAVAANGAPLHRARPRHLGLGERGEPRLGLRDGGGGRSHARHAIRGRRVCRSEARRLGSANLLRDDCRRVFATPGRPPSPYFATALVLLASATRLPRSTAPWRGAGEAVLRRTPPAIRRGRSDLVAAHRALRDEHRCDDDVASRRHILKGDNVAHAPHCFGANERRSVVTHDPCPHVCESPSAPSPSRRSRAGSPSRRRGLRRNWVRDPR